MIPKESAEAWYELVLSQVNLEEELRWLAEQEFKYGEYIPEEDDDDE